MRDACATKWSSRLLWGGLCFGLWLTSPLEAASTDQISASLILKVRLPDETAEQLIRKAEGINGYFTSRSNTDLVLKVPASEAKTFMEYAATLGVVAERNYQTQDVGYQLREARSRLAAREEVMRKYLEVMSEAGTSGVLRVEQEVNRLVGEIEQLKGSIRLMEHKLELAEIRISFQFRDRSAPVRDGRSSFPWLNTMNLIDLVEDFRYGR
ncbi:MAG: DUF4349 domain-containing protein [Myxococcota bacterium]